MIYTMRTIIFATFMALMVTSCLETGQPVGTNSVIPQAETQIATPNSEQQGNAFTISTDAFYQGTFTPASSQGQIISLSLTPKYYAEMTTNYLDNTQGMIDTGQWTTLDNGNLQLNLIRGKEKENLRLEFKTDGDKLVYTGTEYGATGLTLWVKPIPVSK